MSLASLKSYLLGRTMFFGLRPASTAADADAADPALSGAHGGLVVEGISGGEPIPVSGTVTATVDTSALATHAKQDTLAALVATAAKQDTGNASLASILAKLIATPATEALQTAGNALLGTVRHTTTPSKADAATGPAEVDKRGSAHVNAALRHVRRVPLTSGLATTAASLTEGACDCLRVTAGDVIAYVQGPETALLASQSGADWTGGAGWTRVGNVWSHAAGGGASDLEYTISHPAYNTGDTAFVCYGLVWTAGTSVTEKLGTGSGDARSSTATHKKLITSAGSTKIIFSATDDAVCDIDVSTVYVIPGSPPLAANTWEPQSAVKIVALATKAAPAPADTTTKVWAGWYRRPDGVEVT
jgi:hypothetical protein